MSRISVVHNVMYATASRFAAPIINSDERQRDSAVQCPQVPGMLEQAMGTGVLPMDEECLTLNIFSPTDGRRFLPVMVWIHGGAFTNGTANASWYDGSNLAARGGVVVTINYRLGAFGFAGSNDLGLQDQIAALRWIQANIHAYGGDADNVTIFGESAGGCSVLALFAAPEARELFSRGWAMSPSLGQLRSLSRARESAQLLALQLGVASLDELSAVESASIVAAQAKLLADPKDVVTMFSPTLGGAVLPADAHAHIANDQRPLVIGTMRDESRLWVALNPQAAAFTEAQVLEQFVLRFGDAAHDAWRAYEQLRPGSTPAQMLAALQSDESFRVPAWRVIDARDHAQAPTWSYFFTWPTPVFDGILGACHGLDIPFVFDNLSAPNVEFFIGQDEVHRHLADTLADALVQFASTGTPGWSPTAGQRTTLQIDRNNEIVVDPERAIYDQWASKQTLSGSLR